jgi:hypothetical protein
MLIGILCLLSSILGFIIEFNGIPSILGSGSSGFCLAVGILCVGKEL